MPELLLLSPYPKLSSLAKKILGNNNIDYEIIDIPALDSVEFVKDVRTDARVIVSRGGTAKLARYYTNIPVVEIPVTMLDILAACHLTAGMGQKNKAVVTSANIIFEPQHINKIKELQIDFFSCENWLDERIQAEELLRNGRYAVIIGDSLAQAVAAKYGVHGELIESGEEAINLAIGEALRIVATYQAEQRTRIKSRKEILNNGWVAQYSFRDVMGESSGILQTIKLAKKFARSNGSVLIGGETGTGKELFAQSIHNESDRLYGPFISINCSALNDNLFESELFGYDGGAFTGANKGGKRGLFECADKGTIFLDEISEMPLSSQAKLLRVLQEKKLRRVGSEKVVELDVRIICAANKNLFDLAETDQFRKDLYYRLNELELSVPPLRERKDDILLLTEAFLNKEMHKIRKKLFWSDRSCFNPLLEYSWPGNIRELRNFIVKVVTYAENEIITGDYIRQLFESHNQQKRGANCNMGMQAPLPKEGNKIHITVSRDFKVMEQELFRQLLQLYGGNKLKLCADYGISSITLWRKLNYNSRNGEGR